jgi:Kef-type K+ transport system membrane component KefB
MDNDPVIALFLALGVIIGAARLVGGLARKLDQPRVLGELLVGVILGPTVFNLLHTSALGLDQAHLEQTIHELAELGVLLLMFSIGLWAAWCCSSGWRCRWSWRSVMGGSRRCSPSLG